MCNHPNCGRHYDPLELLDETQTGELLNFSVKTLRNWRGTGKGPDFLKLEGAVRYSRTDLIAWCEARRRRSTSDKGGGDA